MPHRVGDTLIVQEDGGFALRRGVTRLPARLTLDAEITWIEGKDLRVRLPETRVILAGQTLRLPATKIKLPRLTETFSWRSQSFEPGEALRWDRAPFYGRLQGRAVTASRASYFTRSAWEAHLRSLGELAEERVCDDRAGLAGHAAFLGVALGAGRKEVLEAFREKAKAVHPDAGGDPDDFKRLLAAREALLLQK
ncbi:MAG TPA: hypothetical protein VKN76_17300 [Kiloniellaceae bacterium]|nr:hypothetical protein [Kiloniellaceae bacterium]